MNLYAKHLTEKLENKIDDEKQIADMEKQMLEHLGYHVTARTSSIEALELFRMKCDKFDLVITDQTMSNMTGGELAENIIKIRPDIPIILCTGFSEVMSEQKARAIGIRKYITKPITYNKLATTIRRALEPEF